MASVTISTATAPRQPASVAGPLAATGTRPHEGDGFAAALNRARGKDDDPSARATTAMKQNGPQVSAADSRPVSPGNTATGKAPAKRTSAKGEEQQQLNTSAAAQDESQFIASALQAASTAVQLPDCSPQMPTVTSITNAGADNSASADSAVVPGEFLPEAQPTGSQSLFTLLTAAENSSTPPTDIVSDAHASSTPADSRSNGEFNDATPDTAIAEAPQAASLPLAGALRQTDSAPPTKIRQDFIVPGHEGQAHPQATSRQQLTVAPPDANVAPHSAGPSTDASAEASASPATVQQMNVAADAEIQAGLATTGTQNLPLDTHGTAPTLNPVQESSPSAVRPDNPQPQSAKPANVSENAVRSEVATVVHKLDESKDATQDEPRHVSTPATFAPVAPATTSSADVSTQHAGATEAAAKEPVLPEPALANPSAIAARAAEALRNAEMHVGWHSDQLGRVDIHAELRGHEVAAAMRVEDAAGRQWLSAELPKLVESLSRQDLRVSSLNVADFANHTASSQGGSHSGTPQQQRWSASKSPNTEPTADIAPEELIGMETATPHGISIHV